MTLALFLLLLIHLFSVSFHFYLHLYFLYLPLLLTVLPFSVSFITFLLLLFLHSLSFSTNLTKKKKKCAFPPILHADKQLFCSNKAYRRCGSAIPPAQFPTQGNIQHHTKFEQQLKLGISVFIRPELLAVSAAR